MKSTRPKTRAGFIATDILLNHLPRIVEGLKANPPYVDENQILLVYDHAVRARVLMEEFNKPSEIQLLQNLCTAFQANFPNQKVKAKLIHAQREIGEVIKNPRDLEEWADVLILFLAAAGVSKITMTQLINAAFKKMKKNLKRKWHPADKDGVYQHKD